MSAIVMGG